MRFNLYCVDSEKSKFLPFYGALSCGDLCVRACGLCDLCSPCGDHCDGASYGDDRGSVCHVYHDDPLEGIKISR